MRSRCIDDSDSRTLSPTLAGGKTGEICAVGFSARTSDISIYGVAGEDADPPPFERLGKHKRGKGCLYVRRLEDVDLTVLRQIVSSAMQRKRPAKS
jgi:hypothetical protein